MVKKNGSSPYRWVVLVVFMLVTMASQVQWLSHAAVTRAARVYYQGQFNPESILNIDFLAMVYMVVYLIACFPASWVLDRKGIRVGIGIGAALTAFAGLAKGIWASSFTAQVIAQTVLAIAQPFMLNAITAVGVRWFPLRERGTAAGLASLAQYLGWIIAMGCTPLMVVTNPALPTYGKGMDTALMVYGVATFIVGMLALIFIRERPKSGEAAEIRVQRGFLEEVKAIMTRRDMILASLIFFFGLGIINAVSSMVDSIAGSIGVEDSDGLIGVLMIVGGIIGAVIVPILSDKIRKRKLFLVICIGLMIPGMAGLAFSKYLNPYRYEWTTVSVPPGASPVPLRERQSHPTFVPETEGDYRFGLSLIDRNGKTVESDTVNVRVDRATAAAQPANQAVTGSERIVAPGQLVMLDGSVADQEVVKTIYAIALAASFLLGFAVMSAGPIGFQYAAEVTHPASESISQGLLILVGQISGIAFVAGMSLKDNAYLDGFMLAFAALTVLMFFISAIMRESPMIITEREKYGEEAR
jgi:MFS family permease